MQKAKTLPQPSGAMTFKQLCVYYKISFPTLKKRLAEVPDLKLVSYQKLIYPVDLQKIFNQFGKFN